MNYLFFDIECASCSRGGKLCEFGYTLTDDKFNIINSENLVINPDCEFDDFVINHMLHYSEQEYLKSPLFPYFYNKIMGLLRDENTLIVGHTTKGDIEHIGDDCIRYGLDFFDFKYIDIVELYKIFSGKSEATSLVKMCVELGFSADENAHLALADANMTMRVFCELLKRSEKTTEQLLALKPSAINYTVDYINTVKKKKTLERYKKELEETGITEENGASMSTLSAFSAMTSPSENKIKGIKGKSIALSKLFTMAKYIESFNLVAKIRRAGGRFSSSVKNCDILMTYKTHLKTGEEVWCKREDEAKKYIQKGKNIEFIEYRDLLKILGCTEKDLKKPISVQEITSATVSRYKNYKSHR